MPYTFWGKPVVLYAFTEDLTCSHPPADTTLKSGNINLIEFSEKSLNDLTGKKGENNIVKIESTKVEKIVKNIKIVLEEKNMTINEVALVLPSELRQIGFLVLSKFIPEITVISREELSLEIPSSTIATI